MRDILGRAAWLVVGVTALAALAALAALSAGWSTMSQRQMVATEADRHAVALEQWLEMSRRSQEGVEGAARISRLEASAPNLYATFGALSLGQALDVEHQADEVADIADHLVALFDRQEGRFVDRAARRPDIVDAYLAVSVLSWIGAEPPAEFDLRALAAGAEDAQSRQLPQLAQDFYRNAIQQRLTSPGVNVVFATDGDDRSGSASNRDDVLATVFGIVLACENRCPPSAVTTLSSLLVELAPHDWVPSSAQDVVLALRACRIVEQQASAPPFCGRLREHGVTLLEATEVIELPPDCQFDFGQLALAIELRRLLSLHPRQDRDLVTACLEQRRVGGGWAAAIYAPIDLGATVALAYFEGRGPGAGQGEGEQDRLSAYFRSRLEASDTTRGKSLALLGCAYTGCAHDEQQRAQLMETARRVVTHADAHAFPDALTWYRLASREIVGDEGLRRLCAAAEQAPAESVATDILEGCGAGSLDGAAFVDDAPRESKCETVACVLRRAVLESPLSARELEVEMARIRANQHTALPYARGMERSETDAAREDLFATYMLHMATQGLGDRN